jgi:hypothetical protein
MSGRQPNYSVGALNRETDEKNPKVGAAWSNDDGSIDVQINDFIIIYGGKSTYLRLFPRGKPQSPKPKSEEPDNNLANDDIPF